MANKTEKYAEVVASASLGSLLLRESRFKIQPEYYDKKIRDTAKFSFGAEMEDFTYFEKDHLIQGQFDFNVVVKKGKKNLLSIKASYILIYELTQKVDNHAAEKFCEKVGVFSTYPYFRQLVSSYSDSASASLPVLPVLKQTNIVRVNK